MELNTDNVDAVVQRLGFKIAQLEIAESLLQTENENLRSQLAGLGNRVNELEKAHGDNLPESAIPSAE